MIDFKEFIEPVRVYLDDPIEMELSSNVLSVAQIYVSPAKTELIDDFFKYWEKVSTKFAHVLNTKTFKRKINT